MIVVVINVVSNVGSAAWGKPFAGDFELTEIGVAVAAFCFLPYCQLTGSNVSADIFTAKASAQMITVMAFFGNLTAFVFSLLLLWRMYYGLLDQKSYDYTTTILQFPHWIAFIPILISLVLLAVAAFLNLTGVKANS